jgi:hypothetical protein
VLSSDDMDHIKAIRSSAFFDFEEKHACMTCMACQNNFKV